MKLLVLLMIAVLMACADSGAVWGYRDATGHKRGQVMLDADMSGCNLLMFQMGVPAMIAGTRSKLHDECMISKGWRPVGRVE